MRVFSWYGKTNDASYCRNIDLLAYSSAAKRGGVPRLAVATEQGTVHVLDTSRRRDWDVGTLRPPVIPSIKSHMHSLEPQRTTFQAHVNGIFDVKWSPSDTLLATASGDQSVSITSIEGYAGGSTLHTLRGHESTVKCVAWDPNYGGDVLCSGGRDGSIRLWDLRVGEAHSGEEDAGTLVPVLTIPKAHESDVGTPKPKGRRGKLTTAVPLKGITHLLYTDAHPYGIVSSSSFDGCVARRRPLIYY